MKRLILFSTSYPYTAGVIATVWLGSVMLVSVDQSLSLNLILATNVCVTLVVAVIGFRR